MARQNNNIMSETDSVNNWSYFGQCTRVYWNVLEYTGIYWNIQENIGIYWNKLECTGFYP